MSGGTFNVSRKVWNHPEFKPEPFSEREAFLWLVSEASWKDRTVRAGRVVVDLRRGQLCASVRFMAEAWQWSKSRVSRFLQRLEKRDMLVLESGTGQLVVSLCNYEVFQNTWDTSGTRAGQSAGHERDSSGTNYKKDEKQKEEGLSILEEADASPKQKRGTRLSPDWEPTDEHITAALEIGLSNEGIQNEADKFRDYWIAKSGQAAVKRDWLATWRNWCRNSKGFNGNNAGRKGKSDTIADAVQQAGLRGFD